MVVDVAFPLSKLFSDFGAGAGACCWAILAWGAGATMGGRNSTGGQCMRISGTTFPSWAACALLRCPRMLWTLGGGLIGCCARGCCTPLKYGL
jgi:hypothetical protein